MDIEMFLSLTKEKENLSQQLSKINDDIGNLIFSKNKEISEQLSDGIKKIFPEDLMNYYDYGSYDEDDQIINYEFDVTDYLIQKYKKDYKKLINRRNKHKISFKIKYNILKNNFDTSFIHHGILFAGLIRDDNLRITTSNMMKLCEKIFNDTNVEITNLLNKVTMVKEIFDDYEGYLATFILCGTEEG